MTYRYRIDGASEPEQLRVAREGGALQVHHGEQVYQVSFTEAGEGIFYLRLNGVQHKAVIARQGDDFYVALGGQTYHLVRDDARRGRSQAGAGAVESSLRANMTGTVIAINTVAGEAVSKAQTLLILEAMKMELRLKAPRDGVVEQINCQVGDLVNQGQVLVKLEAE